MQAIMKRAHEIAQTLTGHYHARMVLALRMAWREAKSRKELPREIVLRVDPSVARKRVFYLRLNRWTKAGRDRIYVDEIRDNWTVKVGYLDLVRGSWHPNKLTNPDLDTAISEAIREAARGCGLIA